MGAWGTYQNQVHASQEMHASLPELHLLSSIALLHHLPALEYLLVRRVLHLSLLLSYVRQADCVSSLFLPNQQLHLQVYQTEQLYSLIPCQELLEQSIVCIETKFHVLSFVPLSEQGKKNQSRRRNCQRADRFVQI